MNRVVPRKVSGVAPTTSSQRRDWRLHHQRADTSFLNLAAVFEIEGDLDVVRLQAAISSLTRRHEALRTTFQLSDTKLIQRISADSTINLEHISVCAGQNTTSAVSAFVAAPFNLLEESAFRIGYMVVGSARYCLAVVAHHILSDQTSLMIMVRDLSTYYADASDAGLLSLSTQFADYAEWWAEAEARGELDSSFDFWGDELQGVACLPPIPGLEEGSVSTGFNETRSRIPITASELAFRAGRLRTTPFCLLLSTFSKVLFDLTGWEDQLIQCGYANRPEKSLRQSIGRFSSNMALRLRPKVPGDWASHMSAVRTSTSSAYAHARVSLDAAFERGSIPFAIEPDPCRSVAFQLVDGTGESLVLVGCSARPMDYGSSGVKDLINVVVERTSESLTCSVITAPNKIPQIFVAMLMERFIAEIDKL